MDDVAIIGVGLHPFGRFKGVSGLEMGAKATRLALADAGITWKDVQFAFGGSYEVDNPDAVVSYLGPTGLPFTDVYGTAAPFFSTFGLVAISFSYSSSLSDGIRPTYRRNSPRLRYCPFLYNARRQGIGRAGGCG